METKEKENILPDTEGMSGENNISGGKNIKKKLSKKTRIIILIDEWNIDKCWFIINTYFFII